MLRPYRPTLTKSAPITSLHTMSAPGNALDRSRAVRRVLGGLLIANIAVVLAKATIGMLAGALAVVVFLSITCFELVRSAIGRLVSGGHTVRMSDAGLALLLATLATNILVAWYENRRGHELSSELLIADAAHTRTDVFITIGVLIGVLFSRQGEGHTWVDPVVAIAVALLIVRVAYQILKRVVPVLVDERAIPEPTIRRSAQAVAGVKSAYGIRSRGGNTGGRNAEVTTAVDSSANVAAAHAIADAVEARLKNDLELEEVTVHVEPC